MLQYIPHEFLSATLLSSPIRCITWIDVDEKARNPAFRRRTEARVAFLFSERRVEGGGDR